MSTSPVNAPDLRVIRHARHGLAWAVAVTLTLALTPTLLLAGPAHAAATDPPTVVSLTFDDGNSDQMAAAPIMKAHGMPATFFINSGSIGQSGFLTRAQLDALAADGNEIGGHTLNHPDLTALPIDEAKRQICVDRDNLIDWGFAPRSFAYPFASTSAAIDQLAQDCGYNSARNLGDIASRFGCADCDHAESTPPSNPYETKALDEVDNTWTLQDFEDAVTNAEQSGGGWVQFTFHNFCGDVCTELSVTQTIFTQFLDWLQLRAATNNTTVKTVGDVIGGAVKPAVASPPPTPITDPSGLNNPGFENLNTTGAPICWQQASYGTNTPTYSTATPGRTGAVAGQVQVSGYTDGDAKLLPSLDLGTCSPAATAGKSYVLRSWYTSTANTQYAVYLRTTAGGWVYWTSSPYFAPASAYTQAVWTTPQIPAGYDGISFALSAFANGTLTSDDYSISATDAKPVTSAAITPAAPDGTAGWYVSRPTVALTLETGSETAVRQYSFDGTTWTDYTAPIEVPDGAQTLQYRSKTSDSIIEDAHSLALKVDTTKPIITPTFDKTTRKVDATVADAASGPGTIEMREGSGAWAPFVGPITMGPAGTSLDFRATDAAGNVSDITTLAVPTALITAATVAPTAPDGTAGWYTSSPKVTLSPVSGTPTTTWEYSFDTSTWTPYTGPIDVPDGTSTLRYRAVDGDDAETPQSLPFKVDTGKPTVTPTFDKATRTVDATATDATSGISSIEHRVGDGDWTTHTDPILVGNDATSIEFRATDQAGDVSPVETVAVPAALITSAAVAPDAPDGLAGWYVNKPQITLTKVSGAASATQEYSVNGGDWTTYTGPFQLSDGTPTLRYRTVNGDDVEAANARDFMIDTTKPTVDPAFNKTTRTISADAADTTSGVDRIDQRTPGGSWGPYTGPQVIGDNGKTLEFRAVDKAGNISATKTLVAPDRKATPGVRIVLSPSSPTYGKTVKATVTVPVPTGAAAPTGNVTVKVDGKTVKTLQLAGGKAAVTLSDTLSVRTHQVTASYAGDNETKPATSGITTLVVKKAKPSVSFTLSSSKATAHKTRIRVLVHVSVKGTHVRPSGRIYVLANGKVIKKASVSASRAGRLTITLPKFAKKKSVKVTVRFAGSSTLSSATSKKKTLRIVS